MRPRLLDLFCGAGGCSVGYHRAGFDVVGVDIEPHPSYPFEFIQADALDVLADTAFLDTFDVKHASPPCWAHSRATLGLRKSGVKEYIDLYPQTRAALGAYGGMWVIENVPGISMDTPPLKLCGSMFDLTATDLDGTPLRLERHRLFESSELLLAPGPCRHDRRVQVGGVYGGGSSDRRHAKDVRRGGYTPRTQVRRELMGIDWMNGDDLNQAIPPAYTEHIGMQLIDILAAKEVA